MGAMAASYHASWMFAARVMRTAGGAGSGERAERIVRKPRRRRRSARARGELWHASDACRTCARRYSSAEVRDIGRPSGLTAVLPFFAVRASASYLALPGPGYLEIGVWGSDESDIGMTTGSGSGAFSFGTSRTDLGVLLGGRFDST
jgi:hypothetical protein